jgi:hydrogenase expression/formation protein HypC
MCLGMPGQILSLSGDVATVDFWGVQRQVRLERLEVRPEAGDYIIEHGGFAVRIIPVEQVADILGMYEVVLVEGGEDPIVRDIICELEDDAYPVYASPARHH